MEKRTNFGSKLGIILASAGSAVGLGNIWRFPTEVGSNGGAAFILIYIACVILLGIPVMLSEFVIGRHTHANTVDAYKQLAPHSGWIFQGYLGVFTAWFILCYYSVVAGWSLKYLVAAFANGITTISSSPDYFTHFTTSTWEPLLFTILILLITHFIIIRGVQKGIERCSKVMMPLLLIIIVILAICSLFMPGAQQGLTFLLRPDFSKINSSSILSAMGQAFFSLSLAMGCLCTYASYFRDDVNLTRTAVSVVSIDTVVAILSGFIIFPAVFSIGNMAPDAGPGLVFITLPNVFQMAFEGVPILGYIFAVLFYLLLILAAITSCMSLHESVTAFLHEQGISRKKAAILVTLVCIVLGAACSLSFGALKNFKPFFGMGFFDFFDFVSAKIFLPIGGIIISLFTGWKLDHKLVYNELSNKGTIRVRLFKIYIFILKWLAPLAIALIFLQELGAINK